MEELNKIVSANLVKFRSKANYTQVELADKIQYSDKSVSKWERGEALPDLQVLVKLAEIYGITVNDFLSTDTSVNVKKKSDRKSYILITLLSVGLVWFLASCAFFVLHFFNVNYTVWLPFIYAIPVSGIVLEVFSAIKGNDVFNTLSTSVILWGVILSTCLTVEVSSIWFLTLSGGVFEILIVFFFLLRKRLKNIKFIHITNKKK